MLTYIIRRLLYSTVVLVLASFLVFTFVTVSGDPLAGLRISPNVSELTVQNVIDRKHLDDPIPKRYLYWVQDAVTNQFGSTLLDNRPILPELWRVMKNTLQLVLVAQILVDLLRRADRRLLRDQAVLRLRLHDDDRSASSASRRPCSGWR